MLSSIEKDPRFAHLYEHNDVFRELTERHKELKREVVKLEKAFYLGPDMDARMQELKKRKLEVKDQLDAMLEEVPR